MIKNAEESGELTTNKIIVEPTSGNTGISLAMIGAAKGYKVKLFMPECVSRERQDVLSALGAEVVLTPAQEGTAGLYEGLTNSSTKNRNITICPINLQMRAMSCPITKRPVPRYYNKRTKR